MLFPAFLTPLLSDWPLNRERCSFTGSFLLQTCTECLRLGHTLFWGHSGERGRMDACTRVEHLLEMQGEDGKWAKTPVNLILDSSGGWAGNKCLIWVWGVGKVWLGDSWVVRQREEQLLGPQVRKELVKEEKQEAGQRGWGAESGRVVGDSNGGGGTGSWGALLPFQFACFSFSLLQSCLCHLKQASKTNQ